MSDVVDFARELKRAVLNESSGFSQFILGAAQFLAHLSIVFVILHFNFWYLLGAIIVYFLMTSIGVSITLHRFLTHKSFFLPPFFEKLGSLFFTLSLQGSTISWVAMHREHHRFADTERDPHCPKDKIIKTHFLSMFYTPRIRFVVDLIRNPFHAWMHRYYWPVNFLYSLMLFGMCGWKGIVYFHLFPAMLCWEAIGVAKTMAHLVGYRNFETGDRSFNIPILGYLTFGEAWHNNHHAHPKKWSFMQKWYEIDVSALVIRFGFDYLGFRRLEAQNLHHE